MRAPSILAFFAFAFALVAGCSSSSSTSPNGASADTGAAVPTAGVQVGNLAPDFALQDGDGHVVHLGDYRGKVVLFELSAMW